MDATKANPAKAGDAKLRGYRAHRLVGATPVEPPNSSCVELDMPVLSFTALTRGRRVMGAALVTLVTLGPLGCADDPLAPQPAPALAVQTGEKFVRLAIAGDSVRRLAVGDTARLSSTLHYSLGGTLAGTTLYVRWSSLAPTVASVSTTGKVVARAAGSASVVATAIYGAKADTVRIVVADPAAPAPVDSSVVPGADSAVVPIDTVPPGPVAGTGDGAELPRLVVDTRPVAAAGRRLIVRSGGNLQRAIDTARLGDVIALDPGATFTGNFRLRRKKLGDGEITIRANVDDALLPAPGHRMTPAAALAARLPRILSSNTSPAIQTDTGAHHYRLLGLEIGVAATVRSNGGLVTLGQSGTLQNTLSEVAHHFILDRVYVHGRPDMNLKRCVTLNSAWTAVINSTLDDCHSDWQDSQAIAGWNGPGPFKIVNNYLAAAGETVMFGGSDPAITGLLPSDIEIRGNLFARPGTWKSRWLVKNSLEFKAAQRVLVEGNVFDGVWSDGQSGAHWVIKSANQNGRCGWCVTQHVTLRYNLLTNAGSGIVVAGGEALSGGMVGRTNHIVIAHNRLERINVSGTPFTGVARPFVFGAVDALTIDHNTIDNPTTTNLAMFSKAVGPDFRFTNNVGYRQRYGFHELSTYAPRAILVGNVFIATSGTTYGSGNTLASSFVAATEGTRPASGTRAGANQGYLTTLTAAARAGVAP
jgi:hypothetical protein